MRWAGLLAVAAAAACGLTSEERATVDSWLLCQECSDGELDSVVALAARKSQVTRDTLIEDLLRGPSPQRLANLRAQLAATFSEVKDYASTHGGTQPDSAQFVQPYFDNIVASYKIRAAVAVATVGASDPRVAAALDSGTYDTTFREDVRDAVTFARDSIFRPRALTPAPPHVP
jgi:hypothetical protein